MSKQVDLLSAHCVFTRDVEIAWLEMWSKPNIAKDLKPNAESVGRYVAAVDVAVTKYREACYATVGGRE
jgi:hypothetical protein